MKVLITGAAGFLGNAVVCAASRAGHEVVALIRPVTKAEALGWPPAVKIIRGDLRQVGDWRLALDADAIIHLAAAPSGDLPTQFMGTVVATENLLKSIDWQRLKRFVHVSSFSVYDFGSLKSGEVLDEHTPIETRPERRDAYTTTKLLQERLVMSACADHHVPLSIIRPGAIYGPGKTWDFGRVGSLKGFDFVFAPQTSMRLTQVDNCADAIVRALEGSGTGSEVFNIVDDDQPTIGQYYALSRKLGAPVGRRIPIPWFAVAMIGWSIDLTNRLLFKGRAKLPEMLSYPRQHVQWKPIRYSNSRAKQGLGWTPSISLSDGVAEMIAAMQQDRPAN